MTSKERKKLARKIAEQERIIQTSQDMQAVNAAKFEQLRLTEYMDWEDMDLMDDLIKEYLSEYNLV